MTKLLLLDCDGTIREPASDSKFIQHPRDQRLIKGVVEAIAQYHRDGWEIYGISNQGGVAAGHKSLDEAISEQAYTLSLIPEVKAIYICPDFEGEKVLWISRNFINNHSRLDFPHETMPWEFRYKNFRKPGSGMLMLAIDSLEQYPDEILYVRRS